jgi:alpha-glucosidase
MVDNYRFETVVDNRDPNRTPMQWTTESQAGFTTGPQTWLPVHINYRKVNLEREKRLEKGIYKFLQSLTRLRKEDTFIYGGLNVQVINNNVLAFSR